MKRSDMLEIIDTILYEHELPLLQGISKEILGAMEKAGMTPPRYQIVFATGKPYNPETDQGRDVADAYGWEPEEPMRSLPQADTIVLSKADAELFLKTLENPPKPNQALIEANEEYRRRVRDGQKKEDE